MNLSFTPSFVLTTLLFFLVSASGHAENLKLALTAGKNGDITVSGDETVQRLPQLRVSDSANDVPKEMSELETETIVLTGLALLGASIRRRS